MATRVNRSAIERTNHPRRSGRVAVVALLALVIAGGLGAWFGLGLGDRIFAERDPRVLAEQAYLRQDYREAAEILAGVLRERPNSMPTDNRLIRDLARARVRLGEIEAAKPLYRRINVEAGDLLEAEDFYLLARMMQQDGLDGGAQKYYRVAYGQDPNHPDTLRALAENMFDEFAPLKGIDVAVRLAESPTHRREGLLLLGRAWSRMRDPEPAIEALEAALQLDPDDYHVSMDGDPLTIEQARLLLARAHLELGQTADARRVLEPLTNPSGLENTPQSALAEATWLLSRADLIDGRLEQAERQRERAERLGYVRVPIEREPAPYVGAARCAECHAEIHAAQQSSNHAKTYHRPEELAEFLPPLPEGEFDDPRAPGEATHHMAFNDDRLEVATQVGDDFYTSVVRFAMGSQVRAMTLVGEAEDGRFCEYRITHYSVDDIGWDMTTGHDEHPDDPAFLHGDWLNADRVRICYECHTTDGDRTRKGIGPTVADRGIGCERCHGPGSNHVRLMTDGFYEELAIARPKLATAAQELRLCGECHDQEGHSGVVEALKPTLARKQVVGLPVSRCYTQTPGGISCTACHSPHHDVESNPALNDAQCLSCHGNGSAAPNAKLARLAQNLNQHVACPVNPINNCVSCHMPPIRSKVEHISYHDHFIRIRDDVPTSVADDPVLTTD